MTADHKVIKSLPGPGYQEPIRGQQATMFWDSSGKKSGKSRWIEERTWRRFCWNCTHLIRSKGTLDCPKCGAVNYP